MQRRQREQAEKEKLIRLYPTTPNRELAKMFDTSVQAIKNRAVRYRLNKAEDYKDILGRKPHGRLSAEKQQEITTVDARTLHRRKQLKGGWKQLQEFTNTELAEQFKCSSSAIRRDIGALGLRRAENHNEVVKRERVALKWEAEARGLAKRHKEALRHIEEQDQFIETILEAKNHKVKVHKIKDSTKANVEMVPFILVSDTHLDERVLPAEVNNLNEFDPDIASARMNNLFARGYKLIKDTQQRAKADTVVIPILGDIISNIIHDELAETNTMGQSEAITFAFNHLVSGIEHIAQDDSIKTVHVRCHTGNHGRTTHERRNGKNEFDRSIESILYDFIANHFRGSKVVVEAPHGAVSYMDVLGTRVRMMHGHSIRYGGGIGGLTIPVNKAIARFDQARQADVTLLGHFHQLTHGGRFVVNGSLAGVTAYSMAFGYEPPQQAYFTIAHAYGKPRGISMFTPIWVD